MSWQSQYVIYLIDPKIKESLRYLSIFEEVFKDNIKIIVFNKIDQIQDINNYAIDNPLLYSDDKININYLENKNEFFQE